MKRALVVFATIAPLFLVTSANAASLQGYWRLNEALVSDPAVDSSGNLPAGTYAAGTVLGVASPNVGLGTAANFPGGAGEVNVGGGSALNFPNNFSVSGWMDLNNTSGKNSLIGNGGSGWGVRSSGSALQITTFGVKDYTGTSGTLSAGAGWQHVVVVLDANNDATFYVDGAPAGFVTHSAPANGASAPFAIGAPFVGNVSEDMDGSIDDVGVFSGSLTATEVSAIYNLANEAALEYDLGKVDQMLTAFNNGDPSVVIDDTTWLRVTGLTGAEGAVVPIGSDLFEINLGAGVGFQSVLVPEPASLAIWSLLGLALTTYGWWRVRRR